MTATIPRRLVATRIWEDTRRLLALYPGERWWDVIHQAVLLKATADGRVDTLGRPKRRQL